MSRMPRGRLGSPLGSSSYVRFAGVDGALPPGPTTDGWHATATSSTKDRSTRIRASGRGIARGVSTPHARSEVPDFQRVTTEPGLAVSPPEDNDLPHVGGLIVVELDVRLIGERNVEAERKVTGRRLVEAETRMPASQIALEREGVIGKLPRPHVVRRAPVGRPVARWTEGQIQVGRLPPRGVAQLWRGVAASARARQRNAERKAPASAEAPAASHPWYARPVWYARASLVATAVRGRTRALCRGRVWRWRGDGVRAQPEQSAQPLERRRRHGEGRGYRLQERIELRGIGADLSLPEIVGDRQLKAREQVGEEGVAERSGLPAGVMRLLGLLEVVADAARADAQQPDLARLLLARRVARGGLQLGLERLRKPKTDGLLRIGARVERATGGVDRVSECVRHLHPGSILITDLR